MMRKAFTLAELLISLVILGVIATFTIPKVLQSQQNSQFNSAAKEDIAMVVGAYQQYQVQNTPTAAMTPPNLTPYMNYIRFNTSATVDYLQTQGNFTCSSLNPCIFLHNGSVLYFSDEALGGTASTNSLWFIVDPDGKVTDGTTNGPGKALQFVLYPNGMVRTYGTCLPNTKTNSGTYNPTPAYDPPWFSWS